MNSVEEAKKIFDNDRYATSTTGCEILEVGQGYAKCQLKITPKILNAYDSVMGGAIYTLADFAFGIAGDSNAVSTTGQITYLSASKGDTLFAEAKMVKDGRTLVFAEIKVTDNLGKEIAFVTMSGMKVR